MEKIKTLLQQVSIIQKKYDEEDKEAEKTGKNFNIFSIMNMEHSEVNTHSAIIGELLNPKGSHGQNNAFLDLFVKQIKETFRSEIDDDHINKLKNFGTLVNDNICERTINKENISDNFTGGRIDIIVEDGEQILIIENKLYAIDQPFQLIRYNNYAIAKGKKYHIILYLTLFGKELETKENFDEDIGYHFKYTEIKEYNNFIADKSNKNRCCLYYPISFEVQILNWIEKCLEKLDLKPLLKATLEQYLSLIKKITFQTMSEEMKNKIVKLIIENPNNNPENIQITPEIFDKSKNVRSAFAIVESIENLKRILYYEFIDNLKKKIGFEKIEGANKIDIVDINDDDAEEYCGVYLNFTALKKNTIGVFFGKKNYNSFSENVFFGFRKKEGLEDMIKKFENKFDFSTDFWVYKNSKLYNNWGNSAEIWEEVAKGKEGKVYQEIITVIKEIIEIGKPPIK